MVLAWGNAVDIGHGRGRLARDAAASLARVDVAMRSAFGRAADINEAWRSPADADENYRNYISFLNGGPWAPIALPGDKSVHCFGYAVDTDDTSDAQMRIWNDNGWYWTVYRNGKLAERWHLEYFAHLDNHRNNPAGTPAGTQSEEDDMYDDNAKQDAANRHADQMRELSFLRPLKLYALVDENGAGGWVWIGPSGRWWAVPSPAYATLVEAQKLSQATPIRAMQRAEFDFLTNQLLGGLVPDGRNEFHAEAELSKILKLDSASVDSLVEGIKSAPLVLTSAQFKTLTDAVGAAVRSGDEDGARNAVAALTLVTDA
ncbi:hypothetical protein IFU40_06035 [Microbacterium sp. CFBP 13617]|uniref:hypothetical protein n=1 Tax=Microbacterium sp. CFBP 13617 TaxID=2774035 RepID=UPI00177F3742|nr:hypothetical protein [Microbacterium sp. CFBP 13617]MBD8218191.1 hypothetical protein [Microbacterium sp. CFBP 13617]